MIDTGADVSLCKEQFLESYEENQDDYCNLTGITENVIKSLGSTNIKIKINNDVISQKIQLVENKFPIKTDGILGRDFLIRYKCNIDYDKYVLTFKSTTKQ